MADLSNEQLREFLQKARSIAIVGAKDKDGQPVDNVGRYLIQAGYTIYPVHPKRKDVWGLPTYPSLLDVPGPIDIVDLFRASQYIPDHAREALKLSPRPALFWMQQDITSPEAEEILAKSGMAVISNACLMVVHRLLRP